MADYTLEDGTEVNFDLSKITMKEWRELPTPAFSNEEADKIVARVAGLDEKELASLTALEYKRLFSALLRRMSNPLEIPN